MLRTFISLYLCDLEKPNLKSKLNENKKKTTNIAFL